MAKSSTNDISLLEELRTGGYESSLIATYNIYLPFYEEVVLRRLLASGCRHNVVLVDHAQCAQAIQDTNYRPGAAGVQYTLVPMQVPGAFHPKITFLAGRKKILILVGSHNLTVAGFTYNRELTNRVEIHKNGDPDALRFAAIVWQTLTTWVRHQADVLPEELIDAVLAVHNPAGWLKTAVKPNDVPFLATTPDGPSLWDQLKPLFGQRLKRVAIVGPFFDDDFSFVQRIARDLAPSAITIGIEPTTVSLGKTSRLKEMAELVDAGFLHKENRKKAGYLHAKVLLLESRSGEHVLVTGSANPSYSAWLAPRMEMNAEAIIVHAGRRATELATRLGLTDLFDQSPLSQDELREIESRSATKRKTPQDAPEPIAIAVETRDGFRIPKKRAGSKVREAWLLDRNRIAIEKIKRFRQTGGQFEILAPNGEMRTKTHEIVLTATAGPSTRLLVHHTEEIRTRSQSSRQVQFRTALASLNSDYPDLATLVATVEKIIFDERVEVIAPPRKTDSKTGKAAIPAMRPETLGVKLNDNEKTSKSHRLVRSGDLGYLLDALIHRLGIGLEHQGDQLDGQGRSEEEQRDQDDENTDTTQAALDDRALAAICRRKARLLIKRMIKQLERATAHDADPVLPLVQLVAVLATLRELAALEKHSRWSSLGEVLVTGDDKHELLWETMAFLYGVKHGLLDRAMQEMPVDGRPDEMSRLPGLLLWLAWDCGVQLDEKRVFAGDRDEETQRVANKAILLALAPMTSQIKLAREEVEQSVLKTSRQFQLTSATQWLQKHLAWGRALAPRLARFTTLPRKPGRPEPGDLAYATSIKTPYLGVVSSSTSAYVGLVDLTSKKGEVRYVPDKVVAVQL